jgi:rubrerythrin
MDFGSIDEVLEFAIGKEQEAADLYTSLAEKVKRPGMRETFLAFAAEEERHRQRLVEIKAGERPALSSEKVQDLKITEQLTTPAVSTGMTYRDALAFAMKAEKAAFKLYTDLAAATADESLAAIFRSLAQEEARHKLHFEIEYDEHVLEGV